MPLFERYLQRYLRNHPPAAPDDAEERARVYGRIAPLIMSFAEEAGDNEFHVEELRRYVIARAPEVAPDSPGRILRELRLEGRLDYVVLNRRQSLYQFTPTSNNGHASQ
jgi:hypothetical protein